MAKMPWLKLYTEIRTDPKMQALSDLEFRTWINILCLSAESKVRGIICIEEGLAYPIEGLARTLFISKEELTSCLKKFQKLRMIDVDQDGIITVIHFDDRQYEKPSDKPEEVAKRARKHREKKSNANVTPKQREENAIEEDEDKEGDIDKDINIITITAREEIETSLNEDEEAISETGEDRPVAIGTKAVDWAHKKWGRMISPGEAEDIIAWCDEFSSRGSPDPDAVVIEALNECDAAGPDKRNRKYLGGILSKWRDVGVLTVDHIKTREAERKSQKGHKRGNKDPVNKASPGKYEGFYL
ncbi:DnaD domain-containing protein [Desulfosporosinus sp.]|uniref:DnaD domain-containing protein n=1 Tax=Desulfosporosinus sp. TaxID=157907 RepID=UPI0025BAC27D|nr:DnaD domain protein [Desulfosporosinus sp.]MBC2723508.1 DnaD domain protein [Desulfosporosinus sp.]MBC2728641.1 DnaD domain protein [Desulfosporosinus sp.]